VERVRAVPVCELEGGESLGSPRSPRSPLVKVRRRDPGRSRGVRKPRSTCSIKLCVRCDLVVRGCGHRAVPAAGLRRDLVREEQVHVVAVLVLQLLLQEHRPRLAPRLRVVDTVQVHALPALGLATLDFS